MELEFKREVCVWRLPRVRLRVDHAGKRDLPVGDFPEAHQARPLLEQHLLVGAIHHCHLLDSTMTAFVKSRSGARQSRGSETSASGGTEDPTPGPYHPLGRKLPSPSLPPFLSAVVCGTLVWTVSPDPAPHIQSWRDNARCDGDLAWRSTVDASLVAKSHREHDAYLEGRQLGAHLEVPRINRLGWRPLCFGGRSSVGWGLVPRS